MNMKAISQDFAEIEKRVLAFCEDKPSYDSHRERAALHFSIPVDQVTTEQRQIGKRLNYKGMYTCTGRIKNA